MKRSYVRTRKALGRYGARKPESIEVDPTVIAGEVPQGEINCLGMQVNMQYLNQDPESETKRVAAINSKEFACTSNFLEAGRGSTGKLKVYSLTDEVEIKGLRITEKTYGLLVLDKYIMVGTEEGTVNFVDTRAEEGWDPQITQTLHERGSIFEMLDVGNTGKGFVMATLGMDYFVKLWQVTEDQITNSTFTLVFDKLTSFNSEDLS